VREGPGDDFFPAYAPSGLRVETRRASARSAQVEKICNEDILLRKRQSVPRVNGQTSAAARRDPYSWIGLR